MELRAYRPGDCPALAALFYQTVHTVNAAEQLDAWAPGTVDNIDRWDRSFRDCRTPLAGQSVKRRRHR